MTMKAKLFTLIGLVTIFLASCAKPDNASKSIDMDALKLEIQALEDAFSKAETAKDAEAVAAYYSEDAVNYNRNMEPVTGKAAIKDKIAERLAKDTTGNTNVYKVVDVFAEGNHVVEIGSWSVLNPAGEEVDRGHYMSYFEKRDGKYLCVRDMNVSSLPAKPGK